MSLCIAITGVTANAPLPLHSYSPANRINVELDDLYIIYCFYDFSSRIHKCLFYLKKCIRKNKHGHAFTAPQNI